MPSIERAREHINREISGAAKAIEEIAIHGGFAFAAGGAFFKDWELVSFGVVMFGIGVVIKSAKRILNKVRPGRFEDNGEVADLTGYRTDKITNLAEYVGERNKRKNTR